MRLSLIALALLLSTPALAQWRAEENADGDWACKTMIGITPVVYLSLSGSAYGLTRPDGTQGKGAVTYTDSPIVGFMVDTGPLLNEFDATEGMMMGGDRIIFDAGSGGIALICDPGRSEKP